MKKTFVLMLGILCLLPGMALADCGKDHGEGHEHAAMDEMAAWMAMSKPGEHHERLAKMAGHWTYTSNGEMGESSGTMYAKKIFDGRFVITTWKGEFGGMDFVGHGLDGYDNIAGKYVSTWIDNFTTGVQVSHGKCADDDCTSTVYKAEMMGPDGNPVKSKTLVTWNDDDTFTLDMYMVPDEGEAKKHMQIVASRAECDGSCKHHKHAAKCEGDCDHKHHAKAKADMAEAKAEMAEAKAEMAEAEAEMAEAEAEMAEAEAEMEEAAEALEEAAEGMAEGDEN